MAHRSMYVSGLHFSKNGKRIPVDAVGMEVLILVLPAKHTDDDDDVLCLGLWWADRQAKKVIT